MTAFQEMWAEHDDHPWCVERGRRVFRLCKFTKADRLRFHVEAVIDSPGHEAHWLNDGATWQLAELCFATGTPLGEAIRWMIDVVEVPCLVATNEVCWIEDHGRIAAVLSKAGNSTARTDLATGHAVIVAADEHGQRTACIEFATSREMALASAQAWLAEKLIAASVCHTAEQWLYTISD